MNLSYWLFAFPVLVLSRLFNLLITFGGLCVFAPLLYLLIIFGGFICILFMLGVMCFKYGRWGYISLKNKFHFDEPQRAAG